MPIRYLCVFQLLRGWGEFEGTGAPGPGTAHIQKHGAAPNLGGSEAGSAARSETAKVDGLQVFQQLKRDPGTNRLLVAMMTSSKERPRSGRELQVGSEQFYSETVDFDQFRKTVKSLGMYWLMVNQSPLGVTQTAKASGATC